MPSTSKVGSAWVLREGDKLTAYSSVCPHLGCAVDFDTDDTKFKCPCHHSVFDLTGKVEGGPAPRELASQDGFDQHRCLTPGCNGCYTVAQAARQRAW